MEFVLRRKTMATKALITGRVSLSEIVSALTVNIILLRVINDRN